jgi:Fur family ferric uptake transcriptional regulator
MSDWTQHVSSVLARAGHRGGKARDAVIELLAEQECCLSAQEIGERLRARGRPVGTASVYRALDQLVTLRLVQRLELGDAAKYERVLPDGDHHHHVLCGECGKVEPFADRPLETELDRLGVQLGYRVEGHDVVLHGACADCRA